MKIHWLIKYYFVGFIVIFSLVFYIEKSKPYVDWSLYPNISQERMIKIINDKDCIILKEMYQLEFELNYEKNFLGFHIRKDKKSIRGLNLLKYLDFYIEKYKCN